jgi:hypothetical protein
VPDTSSNLGTAKVAAHANKDRPHEFIFPDLPPFGSQRGGTEMAFQIQRSTCGVCNKPEADPIHSRATEEESHWG